ncbi:class II aldolase/adducin family protein [Infirmifilum sp. NZ]|uniref:class II aldolase/adducin family protein n=1 Tax=Infirmifilum sp. NZ TaxID=2926850 RepID=UPI0027A34ECE|nr:class II aldolase/adducin family protein [Infirmifilum sp. NZ]UNQ73476.1 class II aldolase/adducin family protein [Infirmifilum sp. NZ]
MLYPELRKGIVEAFRFLEERNLNYGYSGNISVRVPQGDLYLITPSGVKKARLSPEDVLVVDRSLNVVEGRGNPSVEARMHLAIYDAREDVRAIVHAHPLYSSVLAAIRRSLPPLLEETVLYLGGTVEVADYAPSGTEELARNVVRALGGKSAVLLANHGALTCGSSLEEALDAMVYLERAALVYVLASLLGAPHELPSEVVELERELYEARRWSPR